jgi:hypothetical protein
MPEKWMPARLIPVAGIRQGEQEIRAASSLLAVMGAVDEFGRGLLKEIGAPPGRIKTFTEVPLEDDDGKKWRPDGALVVTYGQRKWQALVEVKTNNAPLKSDQVSKYLELARKHEFDAVLTISNHISAGPSDVPVDIDKRKLKKVDLKHLSWWRILTEAVMQHQHRGIKDPDQAWILGELIAYLEHENSGAIGFEDMGQNWVQVRNASREGPLPSSDPAVREVVDRWEQFVEFLCLGLSQDLGVQVVSKQSRAEDGGQWTEALLERLCSDGVLEGSFRVPAAIGPIAIAADLRARLTRVSIRVPAPKEGRPLTRINWLLRQLSQAPDDLRIDVQFARTKETVGMRLSEARNDPKRLLSPSDPKREPRSFELSLGRPLGTKRGRGERSFVSETRRQAVSFYADLVEHLRPWQARAPRLEGGDGSSADPRRTIPEGPNGSAGSASADSVDEIAPGDDQVKAASASSLASRPPNLPESAVALDGD